MYIPACFREENIDALKQFIRQYSFAILTSQSNGELVASHLPLLLQNESVGFGRLIGHIARANSQWLDADGQQVLAIFHGPHAYISPSWYETRNAVPTWNYTAVHVIGKFFLDDSPERRLEIVREAVTVYESKMENPWPLESVAPDFLEKLLEQIVGFGINIERIEGKMKLSQNHDAARRDKVIGKLNNFGDHQSVAVSALMQNKNDESST